jgi:hypothetical protein
MWIVSLKLCIYYVGRVFKRRGNQDPKIEELIKVKPDLFNEHPDDIYPK